MFAVSDRGSRGIDESKLWIGALNMEMEPKYEWRPDLRPEDVRLCGYFAWREGGLRGRVGVEDGCCSVCIIWDWAPYRRGAVAFWGLSERGWVNWSEDFCRAVRAEVLRRIFSARKYVNGGDEAAIHGLPR